MYENNRTKIELKKKKTIIFIIILCRRFLFDLNMITQLTRVQRIIVYYLEPTLY